jgi:hydrogenase maturation protein HypF
MMSKRVNSPLTSSCGRLFDGVAAILNIRGENSYDAQAAIELEVAAGSIGTNSVQPIIPMLDSLGELNIAPFIRQIVDGLKSGESLSRLALQFHLNLAELFIKAAKRIRDERGIDKVALSGGVFQNLIFFEYLLNRLKECRFTVLTHKELPANDGGLSLGQAVIADAAVKRGLTDNEV